MSSDLRAYQIKNKPKKKVQPTKKQKVAPQKKNFLEKAADVIQTPADFLANIAATFSFDPKSLDQPGPQSPAVVKTGYTGSNQSLYNRVAIATAAWYEHNNLDPNGLKPYTLTPNSAEALKNPDPTMEAHNVGAGTGATIPLAPPQLVFDIARSNMSAEQIKPEIFNVMGTKYQKAVVKNLGNQRYSTLPVEDQMAILEAQVDKVGTKKVPGGLKVIGYDPNGAPVVKTIWKDTGELRGDKTLNENDIKVLQGFADLTQAYNPGILETEKAIKKYWLDNSDSMMKLALSPKGNALLGPMLEYVDTSRKEIYKGSTLMAGFVPVPNRYFANIQRGMSDRKQTSKIAAMLASLPIVPITIADAIYKDVKGEDKDVLVYRLRRETLVNKVGEEKADAELSKFYGKKKVENIKARIGPGSGFTVQMLKDFGKYAYIGTKEDFGDLQNRWALAAFDVWMIGTLGAEGIARGGAVKTAVATGEAGGMARTKAIMRAITTGAYRRQPEDFKLLFSGEETAARLPSSALYKTLRKGQLKLYQALLNKKQAKTPLVGFEFEKEGVAWGLVNRLSRQVGPMSVIRRDIEQRQAIALSASMAPLHVLDQHMSALSDVSGHFAFLAKGYMKLSGKVKPEEEFAALMCATKVPGATRLERVASWRQLYTDLLKPEYMDEVTKLTGFSEAELKANYGQVLLAIDRAEKVLENPRPKFEAFLNDTRALALKTDRLKETAFGWSADTTARAIVVKGQMISDADFLLSLLKRETEAGSPGTLISYKNVPGAEKQTVYAHRAHFYVDKDGQPVIELYSNEAYFGKFVAQNERYIEKINRIKKKIQNENDPVEIAALQTSLKKAQRAHREVRAKAKEASATEPIVLRGADAFRTALQSYGKGISEADKQMLREEYFARKIDVPLTDEIGEQGSIYVQPTRQVKVGEDPRVEASVLDTGAIAAIEDESFHVRSLRKRRSKKGKSRARPSGMPTVNTMYQGVSHPRVENPIQQTGRTIADGSVNLSAGHLVAENYAQTVNGASKIALYERLLDYSSEDRKPHSMPILIGDAWPKDLKEILHQVKIGNVTPEEMSTLLEKLGANMKDLFPDREAILSDPLKWQGKVKWIDPAIIPTMMLKGTSGAGLRSVMGAINAPFVFATLYARPTYAYNGVSQGLMTMYHYGIFRTGSHYFNAVRLKANFGRETAAYIDSLAGHTRTMSYFGDDLNIATRVMTRTAEQWQKVTDMSWRRTAVLAEGKRFGVKTAEDWRALMDGTFEKKGITSKDIQQSIAKRARASQVDFDSLSWVEKEYLRYFIFVYPWMSRSVVWCLKELIEHPVKSNVLMKIADGIDQDDPYWAQLPKLMKNSGYIPAAFGENGKPRMMNLGGINTFTSLSQLDNMFDKDAYEPLVGLTQISTRLVYEVAKNPITPKNIAADLLSVIAQDTAQGRMFATAYRKNKELKPIDWSDKEALIRRENQLAEQLAFNPGWKSAAVSFSLGGPFSFLRGQNMEAINAKYWDEDASQEARFVHEKQLILKVLEHQEGMLDQKTNDFEDRMNLQKDSVKDGIVFVNEMATEEWKETGKQMRELTSAERTILRIKLLEKKHYMTSAEAKENIKNIKHASQIKDIGKLETIQSNIIHDYSPEYSYQKWDYYIRKYLEFQNRELVKTKFGALKERGLIDSVPVFKDKDIDDYAREYVRYLQDIDGTTRKHADETDSYQEKILGYRKEQLYVDGDKPIKVNGKVLPSFSRVKWISMTEDERVEYLARRSTGPWSSLSDLDLQLLTGKKYKGDNTIAEGWLALTKAKNRWKDLPENMGHNLDSDTVDNFVTQIDKQVPGFKGNYNLSKRSRYARFMTTNVYKEVPKEAKRDLNGLLAGANKLDVAMENGSIKKGVARAAWKKAIDEQVVPILDKIDLTKPYNKQPKGIDRGNYEFKLWLQRFNNEGDFLRQLVSR